MLNSTLCLLGAGPMSTSDWQAGNRCNDVEHRRCRSRFVTPTVIMGRLQPRFSLPLRRTQCRVRLSKVVEQAVSLLPTFQWKHSSSNSEGFLPAWRSMDGPAYVPRIPGAWLRSSNADVAMLTSLLGIPQTVLGLCARNVCKVYK